MNYPRLIVMAASAGGVRTLEKVVAELPADLGVPVLVVLHVSPHHKSLLPEILARAGALDASEAVDGEPLRPGHIHVAVPDYHLLVTADRVRVTHGPKENHFRPAADVLFRSAAYHFGARAIGVVLSGALADGSAGLYSIKRLGGLAIIQDPDEASYKSMPLAALTSVAIDYALPAREIGEILRVLVREPAGNAPMGTAEYRQSLKAELEIAAGMPALERHIATHHSASPYSCPDCNGVLFRVPEGASDRFRCHTGHAFSADALLNQFGDHIEDTVGEALKAVQETIILLNESVTRATASGHLALAQSLGARMQALTERLTLLRELTLQPARSDISSR